MRFWLPLLALVVPLASRADAGGAGAPEPTAPVRRFAVVAGDDDGGPETRPLHYAHDDARRMADVLLRLGHTAAGDLQMLLEKKAPDVVAALTSAERGVVAAHAMGQRAELVFYYSGHAKDGALMLDGTRLPLDELKARLAGSGADVRIALLDACRSGAITRTKGARRAPAFDVDRGPTDARGVVILTSSANDEDSQESDALTGSFFTTALVTGMMGEADVSGDHRVSLSEAYAYAYDRTVAGTIDTAGGLQHPTYNFDLSGHGDVVLTDLRGPAVAFLVLPADISGTWVVVNDATRTVAAEVEKGAGLERRVALAPGRYLVKTRLTDHLRVAEVDVPHQGEAVLAPASMRDVDFADDPIKGALAEVLSPKPRWAVAALGGYQTQLGTPSDYDFPGMPLVGLELSLRDYLRPGWTIGLDLDTGRASGPAEALGELFPYTYTETEVGASVSVDLLPGPIRPSVGARLSVVSMARSFTGQPVADQSLLTTAPGLRAGISWYLSPAVSVFGRVNGSWLVLDAAAGKSMTTVDGALGLRLEFR